MIKFLLFALFISTGVTAQPVLDFNKRFVESEDRWVAFPKEKDSAYAYGFIYIDAQAGLTLNYEGKFKIEENGTFVPVKFKEASMKVRLQPNNLKVAFIPSNKFEQLQIRPIPDWLAIYKSDSLSIERLYRWGFLYNGWNECAKALTYLEKAQKINPSFTGLKTELAFSYNCLGNYDKAIPILKSEILQEPTNAYTYKELIYSEMKSGNLKAASESAEAAILKCSNTEFHGENCYNLLYTYFEKKDKQNFNKWLPLARKWNSKDQNLTRNIDAMEREMAN